MKKKHLSLTVLKVSSFPTQEGRHVRAGMERIADVSVANCDTDCIGRYCDPNQLA
jgi:hypothetical protein